MADNDRTSALYLESLAKAGLSEKAVSVYVETETRGVLQTRTSGVRAETLTAGVLQTNESFLYVETLIRPGPPPQPLQPLVSGLWQSDVILDQNFSGFIENGSRLNWVYQPVLLPDTELMANNAMVETTLAMAFIGANPTVSITFSDAEDGLIDAVSISPNSVDSDWNQFDWNEAPWNGTVSSISPWSLQWTVPLVFKQGLFVASGASYAGFKIGNIFMKYQPLGYLQQFRSGGS